MIYLVSLSLLLTSWFLPWWGFIPICFLGGMYSQNRLKSWFCGFVSVGTIWAVVSYYLNLKSHGLMAEKMSQVFSLPSFWLVILLTAFLGAFLGGLWSLLGFEFAIRFWRRPQST